MKKNIKLILTIFTLVLGACTKLKGEAKGIVSEKLHKYTTQAVSMFIKNGVNNNLPSEIRNIIPVLKKFGFKASSTDLDKRISNLTIKPAKIAEKLMHQAIDEMTLIDAVKLIAIPKTKAPLTKFLQNKTENSVKKQIKIELDKIFAKDSMMNSLNKSIKMYSNINRNIKQNDITNNISQIATSEIFNYIAQAEKLDK